MRNFWFPQCKKVHPQASRDPPPIREILYKPLPLHILHRILKLSFCKVFLINWYERKGIFADRMQTQERHPSHSRQFDFSSKDFLHPPHRHASPRAEPDKMAVEKTLSEKEDAEEASPPSVRLTSGFEKGMLKLKKIQATNCTYLKWIGWKLKIGNNYNIELLLELEIDLKK